MVRTHGDRVREALAATPMFDALPPPLRERDSKFSRAVLLAMTRLNMALTRKLTAMHGTRVPARIASLFLSLYSTATTRVSNVRVGVLSRTK